MKINAIEIQKAKESAEAEIARILGELYSKTGLRPSVSFSYSVTDEKFKVWLGLEYVAPE